MAEKKVIIETCIKCLNSFPKWAESELVMCPECIVKHKCYYDGSEVQALSEEVVDRMVDGEVFRVEAEEPFLILMDWYGQVREAELRE